MPVRGLALDHPVGQPKDKSLLPTAASNGLFRPKNSGITAIKFNWANRLSGVASPTHPSLSDSPG
jgi:hypothetical protein